MILFIYLSLFTNILDDNLTYFLNLFYFIFLNMKTERCVVHHALGNQSVTSEDTRFLMMMMIRTSRICRVMLVIWRVVRFLAVKNCPLDPYNSPFCTTWDHLRQTFFWKWQTTLKILAKALLMISMMGRAGGGGRVMLLIYLRTQLRSTGSEDQAIILLT